MVFRWTPTELDRLKVPQIVEWHEAARRMTKR